jgi:hypothetical protein
MTAVPSYGILPVGMTRLANVLDVVRLAAASPSCGGQDG